MTTSHIFVINQLLPLLPGSGYQQTKGRIQATGSIRPVNAVPLTALSE